jgi:glutamate dehydrogenase (NAD(P)+)
MTEDMFRFADDLGPAKIIHILEPAAGLKAILVVDNVAAGPAIGGVRMAPDVSAEECFRLARAMTLKNAAAALRHGGGKAVIFGDPRVPEAEKERLVRAFACAIREVTDYIPGPDMGTNESCMAWTKDEIGRAVGLPPEIGGIPLDEIGATGFGLSVCAEVARDFCDLELDGARVAVQGFGSVGRHAARFLTEKGARLVAAADSKGTLADPAGIDLDRLIEHKRAGASVADYPDGERMPAEAVIDVACDIWIPAARPGVINAGNADRLNAKLVLEGANIPITQEAEQVLHERGTQVIPDFIANAGGVICGAVEYAGGTERQAFEAIEEKIRANTREVLEGARRSSVPPREAAVALALQRVRAADSYRRWSAR